MEYDDIIERLNGKTFTIWCDEENADENGDFSFTYEIENGELRDYIGDVCYLTDFIDPDEEEYNEENWFELFTYNAFNSIIFNGLAGKEFLEYIDEEITWHANLVENGEELATFTCEN